MIAEEDCGKYLNLSPMCPNTYVTNVVGMYRGFTGVVYGRGLRERFMGGVYGQIAPCEMRTPCLRAKMIQI